jgi:formamidopyrimidine-DNA glycosylase
VPELPEVETVRAGIEQHVVGRTIATAEVFNPRAVRRDVAGPAGFAAALTGRTFLRAERRGKYLWFALDDTEALLAHLGMSGQFLVGDPGRPLSPHVRVRFTFTDGGPDLRFTDQRTFGHLMLCGLSPGGMTPPIMGGRRPPIAPLREDAQRAAPASPADAVAEVKATGLEPAGAAEPVVRVRLVPQPIVHIAPDPLEDAFDAKDFAARLRRKKTQVKRALLDQSLISGIGNIYADEALWRARLHWARPTDTLRPAEVSRLLEAVREVLSEALKAGGTSFDALYVNINGQSGYFSRSLAVYGRAGQACPRCGTPIQRVAFMNRSSFSCPRCQRLRTVTSTR